MKKPHAVSCLPSTISNHIKHNKQQKLTLHRFEKLLGNQVFKNHNCNSFQSVQIFPSDVLPFVSYLLLVFLNGYFHALLNFVTVPSVRILINFLTQFLRIIFVLVAPRWSLSPPQQKISIAIGGNGSLECQVTAFPTAKITWFKNGKQVQFTK